MDKINNDVFFINFKRHLHRIICFKDTALQESKICDEL